MAKLNTTIHVQTAEHGHSVFGPNEDLPDWAEEKLRKDGTPGIWADEDPQDESESPETDDKPKRVRKRKTDESESDDAERAPQD